MNSEKSCRVCTTSKFDEFQTLSTQSKPTTSNLIHDSPFLLLFPLFYFVVFFFFISLIIVLTQIHVVFFLFHHFNLFAFSMTNHAKPMIASSKCNIEARKMENRQHSPLSLFSPVDSLQCVSQLFTNSM